MALPALIAGGASIIGGILGKKSSSSQNKLNREFYYQDREWFDKDRTNERRYARSQRDNDRVYAESMSAKEREYARSVLVDNRVYDGKMKREQRRYDRNQLAADRDYAAGQLKDQRGYDSKMYDRDIARYDTDRDLMQSRSNELAEKTTASRGIDFVKLRDDAVRAGYNPMTALSMAHAYSKQVDYSLQGGVYSPGANYTTSNQGYSPMGGPGSGTGTSGGSAMAPAATVMPSQLPAGGSFQSNGAGYASNFQPQMSAGSFIADAITRGVDTWANQRVDRDPLADALRNAFDQDQMADQVRDAQLPKGFGYDLTKVKPFQPAVTMGVPSLASGSKGLTRAKLPEPSPSDDTNSPSREALKVGGADFHALSDSSDAEAVETRYGDIPSGLYGMGTLLYDLGANARVAYEKARGRAVQKINGRYYAVDEESPSIGPDMSDFVKSGITGSKMLGTSQLGAW